MPIPSTIDDLSTSAASNSPAGSDNPIDGDNFLRAHASFIAQLRDDLADLSDSTSSTLGDAIIAVKRTETGAQATTVHVINQAREQYISADRGAATDGTTSATTAINGTATNGGKQRITFELGSYACQGITLNAVRQQWRGLGWTSEDTSGERPGATLLKNANGTHLTLSGADCSLSEIHLEGVTASYSGDGLVITSQRSKTEDVAVTNQRGVGMRWGGNAVNGNLWLSVRPISIFNGGDGVYIHHTGGSVTGAYPEGIPDINAGVMVGGDIRRNTGRGLVLENTIDNVFVGVAVQDNTDKGVVLKNGAHGHKFLGLYSEGNNAADGLRGSEVDIELGAEENLILGLRSNQTAGAGARDVNAAGKNLLVHYDAAIGSWVHRAKFALWNPLEDSSTTADSECWVGTTPVNAYTVKGSIPAGTGGKWALFTKANGGAVTERLSVDNAGLAVLQNTAGGLLIGKTTADTTTAGIQIGDSGSGNNSRINMVGSGSSSDTKIQFYNSNGGVGSITTNGSATAYNTSSDYRLKEDIAPADGAAALSAVLSWPIRSFVWKADGTPSVGVIAHELQAVMPSAVAGEKDGPDMQGVDYSKLVPQLVAAVQYLAARVAALEA